MTASLQKDALLAQFSVLAYKDREFLSIAGNLPPVWTLKDDKISPPFAAFAFKNESTGEVVVAFRGTDGLKDGVANLAILRGTWDTQFKQGIDFVAAVKSNSDILPDSSNTSLLLVTGHSLGGAIAQITGQAYGLDGSTIDPGAAASIVLRQEFNDAALAAGLPPGEVGMPSSFTNYLVADSLVSGASGVHLGQTSYLPSVTFSGQQTLQAFLIGAINPVAGIAYAIGTDQIGNDGFAEETDWIGPLDGILVLDRTSSGQPADGLINRGADLFNDTWAEGFKRKQTVLNEIDRNPRAFDPSYAGEVNAQNPVFEHLKVWLDVNGDAVAQDWEMVDLLKPAYALSAFYEQEPGADSQFSPKTNRLAANPFQWKQLA